MKPARLLFALGAMTAAIAGTLVPLSVEKLTRASSQVLLARSADSWTEWNPRHTLIYTITRFQIERALKGDSEESVLVKQLGGRAEGLEQKVSGVRHWQSGEERVLFLRPSNDRPGAYVVVGLVQGDFKVERRGGQVEVSNDTQGLTYYDPRQPAAAARPAGRMSFSELEARVRKAAEE